MENCKRKTIVNELTFSTSLNQNHFSMESIDCGTGPGLTLACLVFHHANKGFFAIRINFSFIWAKNCHLTVSLVLIEPNFVQVAPEPLNSYASGMGHKGCQIRPGNKDSFSIEHFLKLNSFDKKIFRKGKCQVVLCKLWIERKCS